MSLKMRFVRIAALFGVLAFVGFVLPKLGPQAPEPYEGVAAPATTTSRPAPASPTTTVPGLPPGFPSMEYAPPENEVAEGEPIPIDTKFGVSYTVPGDWRFKRGGVGGWTSGDRTVTYGAIADYGYDYCPEHHDGATKARTGMTGRNGVDIETAAFEASREAEVIFRDDPGDAVVIEYSEPSKFDIDGAPAVRYTVAVTAIPQEFECDPVASSFDVVATQGYSNATVAVFMIQADEGLAGALSRTEIDEIVSSLRRQNDQG